MRFALIAVTTVAMFALPLLLRWRKARHWGLPVRVYVDPDDPRPADICGYLAEIAQRLDAKPERMRIVFDGRNVRRRAIRMDLKQDGRLCVLVDGRRARHADLRGRWIADHPVPLSLTMAVLYVEPVDANRFRVMYSIPYVIHPLVYVASSVVAAIGMVQLSPGMLLPVFGLCAGCLIASSDERH